MRCLPRDHLVQTLLSLIEFYEIHNRSSGEYTNTYMRGCCENPESPLAPSLLPLASSEIMGVAS
jgi:hypothetical protein